MQTQVTGEKIIYGFLRSGKTISISVSDDATGQITAVTNTGDPQVWNFETLRGKGAVTWGPISGDTDFVMYVNQGTMTHDFEVNDFIIESERSINNGVIEQPAGGGGSGNTNLSATYQASTLTVLSDSGNDAVLNAATTTQAGVMSAADKTKLDGIATAATANATDAALRDRTTHTGTQTASTISDFATAADARITAQKGANNGLATLDSAGKVPAGQLPSYVDDVLEYANQASFPATGETQKIYVAIDTRKAFRWSGSVYQEISPSEVNSVNGRTGAVTVTAADSLNAAQISGGADAVIGTNDQNELINKTGGKDFKANILPRNMTLSSLRSLVNGAGEIASSSDTEHIVKLHGTPGSGITYVFHPMPVNAYDFTNNVMLNGVLGSSERGFQMLSVFGVGTNITNLGAGVVDWATMSRAQKNSYGSQISVETGVSYGFTVGSSGNSTLSSDSVSVILKQRAARWGGSTFANEATPLEANTGTFQIADENFNGVLGAYISEAYDTYQISLGGQGVGHLTEVVIGDSLSKVAFFNDDPSAGVTKRTPANIGAGGSRVGTTGNAVTDAATFTGGVGTTGYTIGQVVAALKQLGILTA